MDMMIEQRDNAGVLRLPRRLAMANAATLRATASAHVEAHSPLLVMDLAKVEFVDSSGLSVLVSALKLCRARGGDAVLLNVSEQVMALIMLTRLHEVFSIYKDLDAALDGLAPAAVGA